MRNGIFAVGIFRAIDAAAGKQAGQLRDGNAVELLVEDVVHPAAANREFHFLAPPAAAWQSPAGIRQICRQGQGMWCPGCGTALAAAGPASDLPPPAE